MKSIAIAITLLVGMTAGCGGDISSSPNVTLSTFNAAGAPTVEFDVPDMMCPEGCGAKTQKILSEQRGAKEVVINFEGKSATVAIEEGKFDPEAAMAALVDHGFENSTLKAKRGETKAASESDEQPAG